MLTRNILTDLENKLVITGGKWGVNRFCLDLQVPNYIFKIDNQQETYCIAQELCLVFSNSLNGKINNLHKNRYMYMYN